MVGVGGGFLLTPILLFMGIPAPVAVATQAGQVAASSLSGALAHARRRAVDLRMGLVLSAGGIVGAAAGVGLLGRLQQAGQAEITITLLYVGFLTVMGVLILGEALTAIRRRRLGHPPPPRARPGEVLRRLPLRMKFPASGLYLSVIPPLALGAGTGVLAALMGIGAGFILVPAMIYLLRMPTATVVGTSLVQILVVSSAVIVLQATLNITVDILLAALLIVGGVIGAQVGARLGQRLRAEELRALLGVVVLGMGLRLLWDLSVQPAVPFALVIG